jgi:predicted AlkP superfamily phosphohydrolase/phosphomutase
MRYDLLVSRTTNGEDFRIATDLFWVKNRLDVNYVSNQKQVKKKDAWDRIPITRFDYVAASWRRRYPERGDFGNIVRGVFTPGPRKESKSLDPLVPS